ncbi:probable 28S ribosomal protein S25, mitochondrial [Eriocheir sinensis]|uniref:probable 28S ribosomal protein S25, mitochondrial n=1 Tax=Eriocheir sinensis TaxID=95602 RepID=UPI0021C6C694|nr:probable 28S ribosomal protein S25, mitochondrial [Eriocheir sinensis]
MPFMKGRAPIRRTLQYLQNSNLVLKERVKIFTVNYNVNSKHHEGARDFVFWHLAQLQYNNPQVQVNTFKNLTPTPFIRVFFENGEDALVDCDSRPLKEIHSHVKKVFCKTDKKLAEEAREAQSNPANFGWGCERQCICEMPGQVPCPGVVPLPKPMRGKYKFGFAVE